MDMEINFPGGKKVTSTYNGFTVTTDLPKNEGGAYEVIRSVRKF